jgi:hypothetical protein
LSNITRRQALVALSSLGTGLGLSACSMPVVPFCSTDPRITDPSAPLTIDTHIHVFNGSDLQIQRFFDRILAVNNPSFQGFGPILRELGRDFAPSAIEEIAELQKIEWVIRACDSAMLGQTMDSYRQAGYSKAVHGLRAALKRSRTRGVGRFLEVSAEIERQIDALPESLVEYRASRRSKLRLSPESITVSGGIDFIMRNFQFRYVNVYDYLLEYSQGKERKIDLVVAHLVDFDWPIGDGNPTPTSLSDQVRVMEQITRLTSGRVQCFAPFDPMKEVAYTLGATPSSSLEFVQDAVLNHGFIGVKLYPPMGFAPLCNANLGSEFWNQPWLPSILHRSDMGVRLDSALSKLYKWCLADGVPIMAHTSPTNGPSKSFEGLSKTKYWQAVCNYFGGIRIDFGHFGDTDLVDDKGRHARHLSDLMTAEPSSAGEFLYADSAYFVDLLSRPIELELYLTSLMRESATKGDAALAQRLMYGSDWEMLVMEGAKSEQYLLRFEAMYDVFDRDVTFGAKGKLSDRFFGINAASFLGLRARQPNRNRLDVYYGPGPKPAWMSKVDELTLMT